MTNTTDMLMFIMGIILGTFLQLKFNIINKTKEAIKKHQEAEKQKRLAYEQKINVAYGNALQCAACLDETNMKDPRYSHSCNKPKE